ncbi:hypothetical protein [Thermogemmatispora carboxidivorans]|uniref:hypothetical protein n=1 Tax=Thermogemmatispora carboxidivorans TaxID=1382306 RepID=UPI00069ADBA2|nr:hypothetical protein [Thermogemmatispora carboxidivorans]
MTSFAEIATLENAPVIHARRRDEVTVIATRVPFRTEMLERWGWIVTVVDGGGRTLEGDSIEILSDNTGGKYCKILSYREMLSYSARWDCCDWTPGYPGAPGSGRLSEEERLAHSIQDLHEALGQLPRQQDLTALSTSLQTLREQLTAIAVDTQPLNEQLQQLKETLSEAVQTLEEKIHQNDSDLAQQILRTITMIEEEEQEWQDRLSQSTAELRQSMDNTLTEQLEASNHHLKESVQQILADHRQAMQDHLSRQEAHLEQLAQSAPAIEEHLHHQLSALEQKVDATLSNHITPAIDGLTGELRAGLPSVAEQLQATLQVSKSEILEQITQTMVETRALKATLESTYLSEEEEPMDQEAKKLASGVQTLSDKYLNRIIMRSDQYLRDLNKEAKDAFRATQGFFGASLFCLLLTIAMITAAFLLGADPRLIAGSIFASIVSALTTFLGAWRQFQEKTASLRLQALASLMTNVRLAHLQFMIDHIADDSWRKEQYEQIVDQLLNRYFLS